MKIYHGSLDIVEGPEIRKPNRTLDYGVGFYATSSYDQAVSWVKRRMAESKSDTGYINIYEYDQKEKSNLNILFFDGPSEEWVDFVMSNRTIKNFTHDYDVVYGPVANDRVYAAFALYEGRLIDKATLIKELKTYISNFVETTNISETGYLYISNLIRALENEFSEIQYIEFTGFNEYGADKQIIENNFTDLNSLSKEQIVNFVPEYLNINRHIVLSTGEVIFEPRIFLTFI